MVKRNIAEKLNIPVDYEHQMFLNKTANPYEIAIAAARYAREINDRVRKYFGPEVNVQPRNIAMKKMELPGAKIVYDEKYQDADNGSANGEV